MRVVVNTRMITMGSGMGQLKPRPSKFSRTLEARLLPGSVCQDILHVKLIRLPWLPVAREVEADASPKDVRPAVCRRDLIHRLAEIEPGPAIVEIPVVTRPCARGKPIHGERS